jgi:hypothetical protein
LAGAAHWGGGSRPREGFGVLVFAGTAGGEAVAGLGQALLRCLVTEAA